MPSGHYLASNGLEYRENGELATEVAAELLANASLSQSCAYSTDRFEAMLKAKQMNSAHLEPS